MTPQPVEPTSPFFTSVTETDKNGNVTPVFPGAIQEYATEDTAKSVLALLTAQVPEGAPYSLTDDNLNYAGQTWSAPEYTIVSANLQHFNAGLIFQSIRYGGYNQLNTLSQIRAAVTA